MPLGTNLDERLGLAEFGLRADSVSSAGELPDVSPELSGSIDGLDYRIEVGIESWAEAGLVKGTRWVEANLVLSHTSTANEDILAFRSLTRELSALEHAVGMMDESDPTLSERQRELRQLQGRYRSALSRETRRVQRALSCDRIELITNKDTHRTNHDYSWLREQCGQAAVTPELRVPIGYQIERYEYPTALQWCVKEADCVGECVCYVRRRPIASKALMAPAPEPVAVPELGAAGAPQEGAAGAPQEEGAAGAAQ